MTNSMDVWVKYFNCEDKVIEEVSKKEHPSQILNFYTNTEYIGNGDYRHRYLRINQVIVTLQKQINELKQQIKVLKKESE